MRRRNPRGSSPHIRTVAGLTRDTRTSRRLLALIALERGCRGLLLTLLGVYMLTRIHSDWGVTVRHIAQQFGLDPQQHLVAKLIVKAHRLDGSKQLLFSLATLAYGLVEMVEGVGLWLKQRWAEWLTVIVTAALMPVEIRELWIHASVLKALGLAVNALIVVYLVYALRRSSGRHSS